MATYNSKPASSLLSQMLKEHRKRHQLTQEQLAVTLRIEPRTLRAYELGERNVTNINELRRIADLLGVEPERLGVATSIYIPRTPEQIEEVIELVWSLVEESRILEACITIERLIQNIESQIATEDHALLLSLAHAFHAAGYIVAEGIRANQSYEAILYYQRLEHVARTINDHTLLNIGLTYQGDMYRRLGNTTKAITYLEAARDTAPNADVASRGNSIQLLGRAYLQKRDVNNFERTMVEAEKLTYEFDATMSSTRGHYSLGTVYEEYGRSYTKLGQIQKGIDYLDRAEKVLPKTKFWELLVKTARSMALVKGGELQAGIQLAIESAEECRATGNIRYLERVYAVQQYLDSFKRDIERMSMPLRDMLDEGKSTEL